MTAPAGLLERIGGALFPSPSPVDGLITEDDIKRARQQGLLGIGTGLLAASGPSPVRTSVMQALGQSIQSGQQAHQGALDASMSRNVRGLQAGALQREAQSAQARAAARARIIAEHPMPQNGSEDQMLQWATAVYPKFVEAGDDEMINRLTQVISSVGARRNSTASRIDEVVDPTTGKPAFGYITPQGVQVIPGAAPHIREGTPARPRMVTLVNPQTGKAEIAMMDPATGDFTFTGQVPGSSRESAGTESERRGAVLMTLALDAAPILDEADAPSRVEQLVSAGGLREALSSDRQVYEQAGLVIADAYIRLTSGANAPEPEVRRTMRMITPMAGDSPALMARKRATRQALMRALNVAAGRASAAVIEPRRPNETVEQYIARTRGAQ